MKLKENSLIITISLFPLILLLSILRLINFLKSNIYDYVIVIMTIVFIFYFLFSLFFVLDDILTSKKKYRIIFVLLFSIFYLPIYYVKNLSKEEKYLGYFLLISSIVLSGICGYLLSIKFSNYYIELEKSKMVLKTSYEYSDKNKLFTINVDNNYQCNNKLGDYALSCDSYLDDSFFGIYVYYDKNEQAEQEDILSFHIEQTLDYISDQKFEATISYLDDYDNLAQINYNNMVILMTGKNYVINDKSYYLIIVKELPETNDAISNFIKNIESIKFIK